MKKIIIALVMFAGISSVNAQSFGEGTSVAQVGIGFAGGFGMPISVGYEYGITEKIGVGFTAGYGSVTTTIPGFFGSPSSDYKTTYMLFAAKGNYHFYTEDKIDLYGGAILGYNSVSVGTGGAAVASAPIYGVNVGGRYYFTESIGAYAEVGYGMATVTAGLAYKF